MENVEQVKEQIHSQVQSNTESIGKIDERINEINRIVNELQDEHADLMERRAQCTGAISELTTLLTSMDGEQIEVK